MIRINVDLYIGSSLMISSLWNIPSALGIMSNTQINAKRAIVIPLNNAIGMASLALILFDFCYSCIRPSLPGLPVSLTQK